MEIQPYGGLNYNTTTAINNNNHFMSTYAAIINDSIVKISPEKESKRGSLTAKLNISNILKTNTTELMDEEDHHIFTRLM